MSDDKKTLYEHLGGSDATTAVAKRASWQKLLDAAGNSLSGKSLYEQFHPQDVAAVLEIRRKREERKRRAHTRPPLTVEQRRARFADALAAKRYAIELYEDDEINE